ncbi:UNVERIFIED_CONTAM: hypothetical protein FKN15_058670 [Acipenser sinensis]
MCIFLLKPRDPTFLWKLCNAFIFLIFFYYKKALDKNQQWLVYDQQREAYVKGLLSTIFELEQKLSQANQSLQQRHKEGNSEENNPDKKQEYYDKVLLTAKQDLEAQKTTVSQLQHELSELRKNYDQQSREVKDLNLQLHSERINSRHYVDDEKKRMGDKVQRLKEELENAKVRFEEERKRSSELSKRSSDLSSQSTLQKMTSRNGKAAITSKFGIKLGVSKSDTEIEKLRKENALLKKTMDEISKRKGKLTDMERNQLLETILKLETLKEKNTQQLAAKENEVITLRQQLKQNGDVVTLRAQLAEKNKEAERREQLFKSLAEETECVKNKYAAIAAKCQEFENQVVENEVSSQALDKNQQWLVYDQQREAYVKGLLSTIFELEQKLSQANQSLQQRHKEGNSEENNPDKKQEYYDKVLLTAKQDLEAQKTTVSQLQHELSELRKNYDQQSREVKDLNLQLHSERINSRHYVDDEKKRMGDKVQRLKEELENAKVRFEEERKRSSELSKRSSDLSSQSTLQKMTSRNGKAAITSKFGIKLGVSKSDTEIEKLRKENALLKKTMDEISKRKGKLTDMERNQLLETILKLETLKEKNTQQLAAKENEVITLRQQLKQNGDVVTLRAQLAEKNKEAERREQLFKSLAEETECVKNKYAAIAAKCQEFENQVVENEVSSQNCKTEAKTSTEMVVIQEQLRDVNLLQKSLLSQQEEQTRIAVLEQQKQLQEFRLSEPSCSNTQEFDQPPMQDPALYHTSSPKISNLLDESFLECPRCRAKYPTSRHRELLTHIDYCLE